MEVLSAIITIGTLLYHIISKISESSENSQSSNSNANSYINTYELSQNEKLQSMNIDELNHCYASLKITNFSAIKAKQMLRSGIIRGFEVKNAVIQGSCVNIKIKHSIPYNSGKNDYGSSFSINYIAPTQNVIIYGFNTYNSEERNAFYSMANEIIKELSK
jgi:hypothetical protein